MKPDCRANEANSSAVSEPVVSMKIQQNAALYFDWGAASSLGVILLAITVVLFWLLSRLTRIETMFGGG